MIWWFGILAIIALGLAVISASGRLGFLRFFSGLIFIVLGIMWNSVEATPSIPRGSESYGAILILLIVIGIILMVSAFVRNMTMRRVNPDGTGSEEWHALRMPKMFTDATKSERAKYQEKRQQRQERLDDYKATIHRALNPGEGKFRRR